MPECLRYDRGSGSELIGDWLFEVVEGKREWDNGGLERKCERSVKKEVSAVGRSRWVEKRVEMGSKWNIVNYEK
jgi:hypothetical protein